MISTVIRGCASSLGVSNNLFADRGADPSWPGNGRMPDQFNHLTAPKRLSRFDTAATISIDPPAANRAVAGAVSEVVGP